MVVAQATTILGKLGLTENESRLYLGVLNNPEQSGAQMARILKMDKSSSYRALDKLNQMGLVRSSIKDREIVFTAANPSTLKDLLKHKKLDLELTAGHLDELIESIEVNKKEDRNLLITVEYGIDAMINRIEESLDSNEKMIREMYRKHDFFDDPEYVEYIKRYAKKRVDKKILIRQLDDDMEEFSKLFKGMLDDKPKPYKETRRKPIEIDNYTSLRIWDNTTNFISYDDKGDFLIMTINDKYITALVKSMYDYIWERSKKYVNKKDPQYSW